MNGVYVAAAEISRFMRRRKWRYCIIGGMALIRWGERRATEDVDITLLTGLGNETDFVDPLLRSFTGRIPDAREFALKNRVLLCQASNNVGIDIALGCLPFENGVIDRATPFKFAPKLILNTASAEDLIVMKAYAGRTRDWLDVASVVQRQTPRLDWDLILRELRALAEQTDDGDSVAQLMEMRRKIELQLKSLEWNKES